MKNTMTHIKEEIKELIDQLSDELIEDLKPLLERMSEWEATMEVLKDKDMMEQIRSSEEDWQKGKTAAWRDVKRNDL
ncbi:MAG: hypothetical protein ACE5JP_03480 [Candidatus Bipolaricaulia bacterium]